MASWWLVAMHPDARGVSTAVQQPASIGHAQQPPGKAYMKGWCGVPVYPVPAFILNVRKRKRQQLPH